jgi:ribose transport system substrate-binding protein
MLKGKKFFRFLTLALALMLVMSALAGCGDTGTTPNNNNNDNNNQEPVDEVEEFVIGFSNSSVSNSWAAAYFQVAVNEFGKYDNVKFYTTDGNDNVTKQIADVEDLLAKNIDLLMIRPENPEALSSVVEKAYDAGVPVVVTGRSIGTDKYTTFVMLDDEELGRYAAEAAVKLLTEKYGEPKGKVFEIQGTAGAGSATKRSKGINDVLDKYPNIVVVASQPANYQRAMGKTVTENVLQAQPELDLVISASGESLAGAMEALEAAGRLDEPFIVGIDGYNGLLRAIYDGVAHYTVLYPAELGAESVRVAMKILNGEDVPKAWPMPIFEVTKDNVSDYVNLSAPDSAWTY